MAVIQDNEHVQVDDWTKRNDVWFLLYISMLNGEVMAAIFLFLIMVTIRDG